MRSVSTRLYDYSRQLMARHRNPIVASDCLFAKGWAEEVRKWARETRGKSHIGALRHLVRIRRHFNDTVVHRGGFGIIAALDGNKHIKAALRVKP